MLIWSIGFLDEVWWSRFALPQASVWQDNEEPVRFVEQRWQKADPDAKTLACRSRIGWASCASTRLTCSRLTLPCRLLVAFWWPSTPGSVRRRSTTFSSTLAEVIETGLRSESVYLWTLPMFHCNGWCFPWAVTAVGATHVCLRKFDPDLVWDLFEAEGVTHYNGAPTVQILLVNHPKAHPLARPMTVTVAAAPPPRCSRR